MNIEPPDLTSAYPEIFLLVMVCVVMLADLVAGEKKRYVAYYLSHFALLGCAFLTFTSFSSETIVDELSFSSVFFF